MNIGYEDDDLKPFVEPTQDNSDPVRIGNAQLQPLQLFFGVIGSLYVMLHTKHGAENEPHGHGYHD